MKSFLINASLSLNDIMIIIKCFVTHFVCVYVRTYVGEERLNSKSIYHGAVTCVGTWCN